MHKPAPKPANDQDRVAFLRSLNILDTQADIAFDRITEAASTIMHAPIALVSLVDDDRQWFKSKVGLDVSETHRDLAFCAHVVAQCGSGMFVVNDALEDERFKYSDLVLGEPRIRFYAAVPLVVDAGRGIKHKIGTLCIIDRTPRTLEDYHCVVLKTLGELTVSEIDKLRNCASPQQTAPPAGTAESFSSWHDGWIPAARCDCSATDSDAAGNLSPTEAEAMWRKLLRYPLTAPARLDLLCEQRGAEARLDAAGGRRDAGSDGPYWGDGGSSGNDAGEGRMDCDDD